MGLMNKEELLCKEVLRLKEDTNFKSSIYEGIKTHTGETLFRHIADNASLIGGTNLIACKLMGMTPGANGNIKVAKLDNDTHLKLSTIVTSDNIEELFGILFMLDGGVEGTVFPVNRTSKGFDFTNPNNIIPMRMMPSTEEDIPTLMAKYELRSVNDYIKYYVKRPSSIELVNITKTGVALTDYPNIQTEDVVTAIILKVSIDETDMAEYFAVVEGDSSLRRFNAVSILHGERVNISIEGQSYKEHRNITCTNRYNMKTQNLETHDTRDYYIHIYIK